LASDVIGWIADRWHAARDEVRFRLHDRISRKAEIARAMAAFPTDILETDLAQARERLAAALDRQFDAPIRANRQTLAQVTAQAAELAIDMSALRRDHHAELTVAYAALYASKAAFETAKTAVGDADDDLRAAKGRVSSWHSRSRSRMPLYGKRGKPIPQHSFFFFSHSDLDSAKRDAARAASRIGDAIDDRNRTNRERKRCGERIGEIKASKARRRALREAGQTIAKVAERIRNTEFEINRLVGAEERLAGARRAYSATGAEAIEIADIAAKIAEAKRQRTDRMNAFDQAEARDRRRGEFAEARAAAR
jgi:hypothetical protein